MKNKINIAIIVFPASNCSYDIYFSLLQAFNIKATFIRHDQIVTLQKFSHIILPGGFSYGDYLRAGALAAFSPIMRSVKKFTMNGGFVLGICNGFQVLCESGLLPGALLNNENDRFICCVHNMSYKDKITIKLPIAHHEGRYYAKKETLNHLEENNKIIMRYTGTDKDGRALINGSMNAIAGIMGGVNNNIWGMMPHPERMINKDLLGNDGLLVLRDFLGLDNV